MSGIIRPSHLYFGADDGVHGQELWRSNGTAAGTYLVKDICSGEYGGFFKDVSADRQSLRPINVVNGILYFGADDGVHGQELWRSNGTAAGTYLVKDIYPGPNSGIISINFPTSVVNEFLYFAANDGVHGVELWRSDGAADKTYLIKNINQSPNGGYNDRNYVLPLGYLAKPPNIGTVANGFLFFEANDEIHGYELWKVRITDIEHYHQLSQKSYFENRQLLAKGQNFQVCADGSKASVFKLSGGLLNYSQAIVKLSSGDVSQVGSFSVINQHQDSLVVSYKHPTYIQTSGSSITLVAGVYATPASTTTITNFEIIVYRAPVLMVHGLGSSPLTFADMEKSLKDEGQPGGKWLDSLVLSANYTSTNTANFALNNLVVPTAVNNMIISLIRNKIAAGKVDIIGHSMGGILSRLYLQSDLYRDDIHKLITLNTPHSGSHFANFSLDPRPGILTLVKPVLVIGTWLSCKCGALEDLRVDSDAIRKDLNGTDKRNHNKVPSHVIATIRASPEESDYPLVRFVIKSVMYILAGTTLNSLFQENTHDWVVSQTSQFGGLGVEGKEWESVIKDQDHSSTQNPEVFSEVRRLLVGNPNGPLFTTNGFDPKKIDYNWVFGLTGNTLATNTTAKVQITSIKKGQRFKTNQSIPITISGTEVNEIKAFISYSADSIYIVRKAGAFANFIFDGDKTTGRRVLVAVGKTTSGQLVADSSYFYIENQSFCSSLQSGDWTASSTWSCGREPTLDDIVVINSGHTVIVSTMTAQALQINYNGGSIRLSPGGSKVFVKGGGGG